MTNNDLAHPHIWARVMNRPQLATPAVMQSVLMTLAQHSGSGLVINGTVYARSGSTLTSLPPALESPPPLPNTPKASDLCEVVEGIAIIPISGVLVQRHGLNSFCGMTGYDGLRVKINVAASDPDVQAILLDINSGGGEAAGCFELADVIYQVGDQKPVWAACASEAYSAAYALASQAERVWVPEVGGCGSVGVVCTHFDYSQAMEQEGIAVTLIAAGEHKTDGHPYGPLPAEVRARIQAEVDSIRNAFIARVARGRGISKKAVRATQAQCLTPSEALSVGFATDKGDIHQALDAMIEGVRLMR